jgi:hypothetical protein
MLTNIKLHLNSYQFQENLSQPGIIDAKSRYRAAAWRFRNTALGDITMCSLAHTTRLLDCQPPTLVVRIKNCFTRLFFILGGRFACVRMLPFIVLHEEYVLYPVHLREWLNRFYLPFVGCSQRFQLRDLWIKPFLHYTKGFLNGHLQ